jgi:hypothetical protein
MQGFGPAPAVGPAPPVRCHGKTEPPGHREQPRRPLHAAEPHRTGWTDRSLQVCDQSSAPCTGAEPLSQVLQRLCANKVGTVHPASKGPTGAHQLTTTLADTWAPGPDLSPTILSPPGFGTRWLSFAVGYGPVCWLPAPVSEIMSSSVPHLVVRIRVCDRQTHPARSDSLSTVTPPRTTRSIWRVLRISASGSAESTIRSAR